MAYQLNELQEKWLEALESGKYAQGKGWLARENRFCCLGVAAVVCGIDEGRIDHCKTLDSFLGVRDALHLRSGVGSLGSNYSGMSLTGLNDESGKTFPEIAAFIRANPDQVFEDYEAQNGGL